MKEQKNVAEFRKNTGETTVEGGSLRRQLKMGHHFAEGDD